MRRPIVLDDVAEGVTLHAESVTDAINSGLKVYSLGLVFGISSEGDIPYSKRAVENANSEMIRQAVKLQADRVLGVRYDSSNSFPDSHYGKTLVYGEAVRETETKQHKHAPL